MKHLYNTSVESEHRLNEMARVSTPEDKLKDGVEIWIYGENDEQGTKVPHFHVIGKNFEFEVHIQHIYELNIWRTKFIDKKRNINSWNERSQIRKSILNWLHAQSKDLPVTNAEVIVLTWNQNNPSNRITQSYKL